MIKVLSNDGRSHNIRFVSIAFKEVLVLWQRVDTKARIFCSYHGSFESIAIYDPNSIQAIKDPQEEILVACEDVERNERERFLSDCARARRKT